jgi:hypothetical protein
MSTRGWAASTVICVVLLAGCASQSPKRVIHAGGLDTPSPSPIASDTPSASTPSHSAAGPSPTTTAGRSSGGAASGGGSSTVAHGTTSTGGGGKGSTTNGSNPAPPTNPSCPARAKGQSGGRWHQAIYLASPGTHEYPHALVHLRACSSSGLPVRLSLESVNNCELHGTALDAVSPPASCVVVASQAGNSRFLPAATVRASYRAIEQQIVGSWGGPSGGSTVSMGNGLKVTIVVRSGSSFEVDGMAVVSRTDSVCDSADVGSFTSTGTKSVTVDIPLHAVGVCTLHLDMGGAALNQVVVGARDISFHVVA